MKAYQDSNFTDTTATNFSTVELGTLYEPSPVAFTFETIGWSMLAGVLAIALLVSAAVLIRNHIRNRYRREALRALDAMRNNTSAFAPIFVLLKQVAIRAFGREKVGNLHGKAWLAFLENTGKNVKMLSYEKQLEAVLYRGETLTPGIRSEILFNAKQWIKTHEHPGQL